MSTLEQIESIKTEAEKGVALGTRSLQVLEILHRKQLATEQSLASLGKVISSLTKVLIEKSVLTDTEVMGGVTAIEVENDQRELAGLLEANLIVPSEKVGPHSFVVASLLQEDGKGVPYRLFKLGELIEALPAFVSDLQERVVGDSLPVALENGMTLNVTVLEVYDVKSEE